MINCSITIGVLIDKFLISTKLFSAPATHKWYAHYLHSFRAYAGEQRAEQLTASVVYSWLQKCHGRKSASTQHAAARTIVRALNWAIDENILNRSPLSGFRKPTPSHREALVTPEQYALCLRTSRDPLRYGIKFLWHTGCRPQEFRIIESRWVAGQKIILPKQQSKGKRFRRVIYLDSMATGLAARLSEQRGTGPIFRNSEGNAWSKDGLALAFRRLREQTGIDGLCAYSIRHSFITRLLERGVDVATVAAISGNSPRMVLDVYSHVTANEARLLRQLG